MPPQVSAIVLAAGSSRRMGRSKQLLPLGHSPVIRHCLDTIVASGLRDIVVVLGADHDGTAAAISGMPVRTVVNADPQSDMAGSVRLGLRQVDRASTSVLICLADHPLVSSETIMGLVNAHRSSPDSILIPLYQGRRGHPTLFPRKAIEDIFSVETLRDVIASRSGSVRTVDVDDEGVVLDLDTTEDYERIKQRFT
ncbi:MAG: nucleotidyltransferase family protein [Nitrospirae bacterium]|nr:nucleotidyltransferase family protein [Nitrospirota bacterium]